MPSFSPRIPLTFAIAFSPLQLDLDVHTGGEIQALQLLHGLGRGLVNVDQPLVREHLEMLSAVLVLVRRPDHREDRPLRGQRHRPHDLRPRPGDVVDDLPGRRVEDLVVVSLQFDPDLRCRHLLLYFRILVTRPAPTVRPPSRMAKRSPSSMAMGAIISTVISVLSPGITISVPSGVRMAPVTSVVRK